MVFRPIPLSLDPIKETKTTRVTAVGTSNSFPTVNPAWKSSRIVNAEAIVFGDPVGAGDNLQTIFQFDGTQTDDVQGSSDRKIPNGEIFVALAILGVVAFSIFRG